MYDLKKIRNFSIIAHIDHGKSTLADRILEISGSVERRNMKEQFLDNLDVERERGITVKLRAVTLDYKGYQLNLIDTPGHVDFSYEVSRSLAACEGALLVVDASQGVEAQTLANVYLAIENNLEVLPVLNKIDLPHARPDEIKDEIEEQIGISAQDAVCVSAKSGLNIDILMDRIIEFLPPPQGDYKQPLKALIFDSVYDEYRGVIVFVRIMDGEVKTGDLIKTLIKDTIFEVTEVGCFSPGMVKRESLKAGEVGYITAGIKSIQDIHVGDTLTLKDNSAEKALPGYKEVKPMVFSGLYPIETVNYVNLKDALEKLTLNDSSLKYEPESSIALGMGFRCGFLGLLHSEVVRERLEQEFDLEIIATAPSVKYRLTTIKNKIKYIENPMNMPDPSQYNMVEEPYIKAELFTPSEYVGAVMNISEKKRGVMKNMKYLSHNRVELTYEFPLAEIVVDFYDKLKSSTRGYASMDYELIGYRETDVTKLDIKINGESVDALSMIVHVDKAYEVGRLIVYKLRDIIPKQMFKVPIQACIGGKIIARETVSAMRKDVLAKCYGGDITRKRKLLEKQKDGKKRMKSIGSVEIPRNAFLEVLRVDD
ncbi:MAG: translation elongation factor 4 [Candidatus Muirbacterium halophilum]|nr:translation elongation factor 4 [Candidatus Muirbacterium halophilum]MCK9475442.1 translation elongation factor 4 [Candidatus Muirbacterium halophilum]